MLANASYVPARILGLLCIFITFGMLIAGLQPFHSPRNGISWETNPNGLSFGRYGALLSSRAFALEDSQAEEPCSLELWVQPHSVNRSGTLLAFYSPDNLLRFSLRQDGVDLVIEVERRDAQHRTKSLGFYVSGVFRKRTAAFVTLASTARGTAVYLDGILIKTLPGFVFSANLTGWLVVGTSPIKNDEWSGQLRGLALYRQELTPAEVLEHFRAWGTKGRPYAAGDQPSVALYLFDEHSGSVVHDHGSSGVDLNIPEKYVILHEKLLEPAWKEFNLRWGYCESALINIVGFIPFGFFVCAYLSLTKSINRAAVATVLLGATLSLTIEVIQAYLPTRDSGTTDLITNTLGTGLGVSLYRWKPSLLSETLSSIPFTRWIRIGMIGLCGS